MVSVRETIIAITTQNLNSNPKPKKHKLNSYKRTMPGALIGNKITRAGGRYDTHGLEGSLVNSEPEKVNPG